jgi:hypothetical protein
LADSQDPTPDQLAARDQWASERWSQFANRRTEYRTELSKFLFVVHSGGAAAVLAYLGQSAITQSAKASASWILGFFVAGLVFIGLVRVTQAIDMGGVFKAFREDYNQYQNGLLTWANLIARDRERYEQFYFPDLLLGISFVVFLIGCVAGYILTPLGR